MISDCMHRGGLANLPPYHDTEAPDIGDVQSSSVLLLLAPVCGFERPPRYEDSLMVIVLAQPGRGFPEIKLPGQCGLLPTVVWVLRQQLILEYQSVLFAICFNIIDG